MNAKAVIFFCNWSAYPGLQLSQNPLEKADPGHKMMVSMCSGRISPEIILEAFKKGAWGVLITACPEDKCEHDGNYRTYGRIVLLKIMLRQMGMDSERLRLAWIDKGEAAKLQDAINTFMGDVEKLGPVNILGSHA